MHETYFGLVKATERYNADEGNSFFTYAEHWIRQAIKRYLENSGQMIWVPVHRQQEIYKYNQATSYYMQHYDRKPDSDEYAWWVGISINSLDKLEKFMFQGAARSLDEIIPGNDNITLLWGIQWLVRLILSMMLLKR